MILLDTNAVYWSMTGSGRMGPAARARLEEESRRCVSSISHVELAIKQMKGKLHLPPDLPARLTDIGLDGLPYNEAHAAGIHQFPGLVSHDPFDRMLLAQAAVERATFLTADRTLLALDLPWIIDASR